MLYYECKKILVKRGTKMALLVLAAVLAITCYFAIHDVYYIDDNGDHVYGLPAISRLKEMKKEWSGLLTEEVIAEVIAENRRINDTEEGRAEDVRSSNIAYGWKLGFHDIYYLLMRSFCKFREADYYKPNSLVPEDARSFYGNRVRSLQEWLEEPEQEYRFNDEERAWLIGRYEGIETPFYYDYADGWKQLFEFAATVMMLMMLVLAFICASIFSGEFQQKADSVFFSSCHGRGKAVAAKLGAAFLFVTVVYFVTILLYSVIVLGILGTDGVDLLIQTNHVSWKSFYSLTNFQQYLLTVFGGYIGTLFFSLLTMLVSAKTRSAVLAVMVPFFILFLPSFIGGSVEFWVDKVLALMPDRLLDMNQCISYFYLYHAGGQILGSLHVLPALYGLLSVILLPVIYTLYRRMQVK